MKPQPLIILLGIFRLSLEPIEGMKCPNLASCHFFILFYYRQIRLGRGNYSVGSGRWEKGNSAAKSIRQTKLFFDKRFVPKARYFWLYVWTNVFEDFSQNTKLTTEITESFYFLFLQNYINMWRRKIWLAGKWE